MKAQVARWALKREAWLLGILEMFRTLIVVIVTGTYKFVRLYQNVCKFILKFIFFKMYYKSIKILIMLRK